MGIKLNGNGNGKPKSGEEVEKKKDE